MLVSAADVADRRKRRDDTPARSRAGAAQNNGKAAPAARVCKGEAGMALEMKTACMKCAGPLHNEGAAYMCSYECTFCAPCTASLAHICPNCGGDLQRRPMRRPKKT